MLFPIYYFAQVCYLKLVWQCCNDIVLLQNVKPTLGSKPCLIFTGDAFDGDAEYKRLKNCLIGEIVANDW